MEASLTCALAAAAALRAAASSFAFTCASDSGGGDLLPALGPRPSDERRAARSRACQSPESSGPELVLSPERTGVAGEVEAAAVEHPTAAGSPATLAPAPAPPPGGGEGSAEGEASFGGTRRVATPGVGAEVVGLVHGVAIAASGSLSGKMLGMARRDAIVEKR